MNPDTQYDCSVAWKQCDGINPPIPATPKEMQAAREGLKRESTRARSGKERERTPEEEEANDKTVAEMLSNEWH